jgi:hypothetical protein
MLPLAAQSFRPESSYHSGDRNTPRQEFIAPGQGGAPGQPEGAPRALLSPDAHVRMFLKQNAARYGFDANLKDVRQIDKQKSLLGTHYRFQQFLNDKEVITGQIVVTTDSQGNVTEISNNLYPAPQNNAGISTEPKITSDQAFDLVWKDLRVPQGAKLIAEPLAELKYYPSGRNFRLVYDVQISVDKPIGSWEYAIAADNGEIVHKQARVTNLDKYGEAAVPQGPLADRSEAFGNYVRENRRTRSLTTTAAGFVERADGQGLAFNPDPVTALKDDTLTLAAPDAKFDGAYATVTLKDLKKDNGLYRLEGPFVKLVDIEKPSTPPSTSPDGIWRAKRGDNAFNDVMVYYHLSAAQNYLHALGFASLIARPIEADSDGLNGEDNSHHVPSQDGKSGYLAFGHGGVPDPEDASVIWHEYGHAVHAEIVGRNWAGGDSRTLGEGFGDYWAASYNYSTANGRVHKPNRLFKWDGVPWGGRSVDLKGFKYDPNRIYGRAHEPLDPANAKSPDTAELWSTPLFQSLVTLVAQSHKREEADSIVVQSMFGLTTSGFTIRDAAQKVIDAAQKLYPNEPHWKIFLAKFKDYNICPPEAADSCPSQAPIMATNETAKTGEAAAKK